MLLQHSSAMEDIGKDSVCMCVCEKDFEICALKITIQTNNVYLLIPHRGLYKFFGTIINHSELTSQPIE